MSERTGAKAFECAFIALGSNLGDRAGFLWTALVALSGVPGCRLIAASRVEETAPFGPVAQGPYLNQMVALHCALTPLALLDELQRIERSLGRVRRERWGPRTIDLDLVRQGSHRLRDDRLTLPHPGLTLRDFWQREMAELETMLERTT